MNFLSTQDPLLLEKIQEMIKLYESDTESLQSKLVTQLLQNSLKLLRDGHNIGQIKLINNALKEIRYAYSVFNQYSHTLRVSIFGSSRTPEDHPDYVRCRKFSKEMADQGWMSITGAADGIMKAGHEGSQAEDSFGLSIRLPFESNSNAIIAGDPKLISFRYFFTRKLMFLTHSHAISAFPGGFGTQDEIFECLTLMQTGKASIIPVVLLEGAEGVYWKFWDTYVRKNFLEHGWISPEDLNFYFIAENNKSAVDHLTKFYSRYHSSRYVAENLVIRMKTPLQDKQIKQLNDKFSLLIKEGKIEQRGAFEIEKEFEELPRLVFHHTKNNFGTLRALIDCINDF
jgi:uncharacterized protein (TIGR00730 family)